MQLHGGNGYTTEQQVERHWRDARLNHHLRRPSEISRVDLLAKRVIDATGG